MQENKHRAGFIFTEKSKGIFTSVFRGDDINEFCSEKKCLQREILNKSFRETIEILKNQPLGFAVVEPEHLNFKYKTTSISNIKKKKKKAISKKFKQNTLQTAWKIPQQV